MGAAMPPAELSRPEGPAGGRPRLRVLTGRERDVLALMAEGRTNAGVARRLCLSPRTVEAHVRSIMAKLGLPESDDDNRRVLAVLTYLDALHDGRPGGGYAVASPARSRTSAPMRAGSARPPVAFIAWPTK